MANSETKTRLIFSFGKIKRDVVAPNNIEDLWTSIFDHIPGLEPYKNAVVIGYVDDEGDEIRITITDELQEALRVGAHTSGRTLLLSLTLPNADTKTLTTIEESVRQAPKPPIRGVAVLPTTPKTHDILHKLQSAGATAISELNTAVGFASQEITKLFSELGNASSKQKELEAQLNAKKLELVKSKGECDVITKENTKLKEQLLDGKRLLADCQGKFKKLGVEMERLQMKLSEASDYENKWKVSEMKTHRLRNQLQALRNGLAALTSQPLPKTTHAEVISSEAVPHSPLTSLPTPSMNEPLPPYPSVESLPESVIDHDKFPVDCPSPSPLELQMQQLRDMGINMTKEQLDEKLAEHDNDFQQVINSLF